MKKTVSVLLAVLMTIVLVSSASATGNTLPKKFLRQFQVGNGLTGSLAVHGNTDAGFCPFLSAVQNAEYSILCIQSDENTQYCIYQPGENDQVIILADYCILNGQKYLLSSFAEGELYAFPDENRILNLLLDNTEGENPAVLADILQMIFSEENDQEINFSTELLEKQIELWVAGYRPETTIQKDENSDPAMTQVFTIPVEDMYNTVVTFIGYITQNEEAMNYLRSVLTEEQISVYFNSDLGYYYTDAMKKLDLQGDIVFSRTVSTMGKLLNNSLTLPLDPEKTGYSSLTLQNSGQRRSFLLSGADKTLYLNLPVSLDLDEEEYTQELQFVHYDKDAESDKNVSMNIEIKKKHEEYDDPDEGISHETDRYKISIRKDISFLPETVSADSITEMGPTEGTVEIHYASKPQLSSPTILEFSLAFTQGSNNFDLSGKLTTTSPDKTRKTAPWAFTAYNTDNAVKTDGYTKQDFTDLFDNWIRKINAELAHTPEEIRQTESAEMPDDQNT